MVTISVTGLTGRISRIESAYGPHQSVTVVFDDRLEGLDHSNNEFTLVREQGETEEESLLKFFRYVGAGEESTGVEGKVPTRPEGEPSAYNPRGYKVQKDVTPAESRTNEEVGDDLFE